MEFSDTALVINIKPYSESDSIVKIFSENHGICRGFVKKIRSRSNRLCFQIGNLISFQWKSRNEEGLGSFYYNDLIKSFSSRIVFEKLKLNCMMSLFSIIDSCFLERDNHHQLFNIVLDFLQKICIQDNANNFLQDYIRIEIYILSQLGYGLDISSCAVTNKSEDLAFISPKSGRAVCYEVGLPYENKLFKLPKFLVKNSNEEIIENNELVQGLKISGYFIKKFTGHNKNLSTRKNIIDYLLRHQKS